MKHKNVPLLSLFFFLFPATNHGMEQEIVIKPLTIQHIRNNRDKIINERLHSNNASIHPFDAAFFQELWYSMLKEVKIGYNDQDHDRVKRQTYKTYHEYRYYDKDKEYSLLGIAAIAMTLDKNSSPNKTFYSKLQDIPKLRNKKVQDQPSLKQKKELIQQLLALKIEPTQGDKEFALLAKYEEFTSSIIKKYIILQNAPLLLNIEAPQEIIKYITLFMWEKEEALL